MTFGITQKEFEELRDILIIKFLSFSSTFLYQQNSMAVVSTKKKSRIRTRVNLYPFHGEVFFSDFFFYI